MPHGVQVPAGKRTRLGLVAGLQVPDRLGPACSTRQLPGCGPVLSALLVCCCMRCLSTVAHTGESGVDQLVEIIKVLGTPTKEEIHAMNPNYTEFKFPQIKAHPWTKVFSKRMPPDAIDLVSRAVGVSLLQALDAGPGWWRAAAPCAALCGLVSTRDCS